MKLGDNNISKLFLGTIEIAKVYLGNTLIWQNLTWYQKTGSLWSTIGSALASWGWSVNVNTGVKTTPERVKPLTISITTTGGQQDNSFQQMTRTITGYRRVDGVGVELFTVTSALGGSSFTRTDIATIRDGVEYNRFTASCSGKLKAGSRISIVLTEWFQNTP